MTAIQRPVSGATRVAGVVGAPVRHSLSPLIHNAWLSAAKIDGLYAPFEVRPDGFDNLVSGLRGGSLRGLNVTLPLKARALAAADRADEAARKAGAANLLLFEPDGRVVARNTDGLGLLAAFAEQAESLALDQGPVVVLGAGGAARGAIAALVGAGVPEVRIVNRTLSRAQALSQAFAPTARAFDWDRRREALDGAIAIINATSAGLDGVGELDLALDAAAPHAVVMDMVYKPLATPLLRQAASLGLATVDGLAMLIGQARPSFEALFEVAAPTWVDVRALALLALGEPA